jgi:hypothetical protein
MAADLPGSRVICAKKRPQRGGKYALGSSLGKRQGYPPATFDSQPITSCLPLLFNSAHCPTFNTVPIGYTTLKRNGLSAGDTEAVLGDMSGSGVATRRANGPARGLFLRLASHYHFNSPAAVTCLAPSRVDSSAGLHRLLDDFEAGAFASCAFLLSDFGRALHFNLSSRAARQPKLH